MRHLQGCREFRPSRLGARTLTIPNSGDWTCVRLWRTGVKCGREHGSLRSNGFGLPSRGLASDKEVHPMSTPLVKVKYVALLACLAWALSLVVAATAPAKDDHKGPDAPPAAQHEQDKAAKDADKAQKEAEEAAEQAAKDAEKAQEKAEKEAEKDKDKG